MFLRTHTWITQFHLQLHRGPHCHVNWFGHHHGNPPKTSLRQVAEYIGYTGVKCSGVIQLLPPKGSQRWVVYMGKFHLFQGFPGWRTIGYLPTHAKKIQKTYQFGAGIPTRRRVISLHQADRITYTETKILIVIVNHIYSIWKSYVIDIPSIPSIALILRTHRWHGSRAWTTSGFLDDQPRLHLKKPVKTISFRYLIRYYPY